MKEKAAYLKGLIDGLGIDENTKEGKVIKAMSELLSEMAEAVDSIDEDVTHAYDQINDLEQELGRPLKQTRRRRRCRGRRGRLRRRDRGRRR